MMKRLFFFAALFIVGAYFTSCQKGALEATEDSTSSNQSPDRNFDAIEIISEKWSEAAALNEARLALLGSEASRECVQTAIVPDNYPTIQAALDAVCEYGNVHVKSGTYNEPAVYIIKPGVKIKAIGDVTLNGGFVIWETNDVSIQNFKIDMTTAPNVVGIVGFWNEGIEVKQNTIIGTNHIGVYFRYCNDVSIVQNNLSGVMDWGIFIDGYFNGGSCTDNTIANNIVSSTNGGIETGIQLRGDCDDNLIQGNQVYSCLWGISLWRIAGTNFSCDNNILKINTSNNNVYTGIELGLNGQNNTFGPNNIANNNGAFGIALYDLTSNNYAFNNTALNNVQCDIVNYGTKNKFKNNTANCTTGIN